MDAGNTITINGNVISLEAKDTILTAARRHAIDIPTLCHLKGATPSGACRVCVVALEGSAELVTACSTPATEGMVVHTESAAVVTARKEIIQLLLSSGNHNCAIAGSREEGWEAFQMRVHKEDGVEALCPAWGDCRLQDLAYRYQVSALPAAETRTRYPMEAVNPFIVRDFSRCILCGRCVQACNEIQVNNAINFGYKGADTKIVAGDDVALKDSDCVFCGECIQACPVGALVEKETRYSARPWETRRVRTTCSYCGVGCQMDLHVKDDKVVRVTGFPAEPPNFGSLCVKGRFGFDFINSPERLKTPMVRKNDKLEPATWDEALTVVADRLKEIRDQHGGDSMGVLTSARVSNEENYLANKFTRAVLKTNNIDHCARL